MKEDKFLITFMIYDFWVGVIPFELWSNKCTVKLLYLHTVYHASARSPGVYYPTSQQ